jgi:4-hydroxybenzoate polyprenyltransferase
MHHLSYLSDTSLPAIIPGMLGALLRSLRPKQWVKNLLLFAALVFDQQFLNPPALLHTFLGFVILCLAASAVYVINDLADLDADRAHPVKRHRPLASGALPVSVGRIVPTVVLAIAIPAGLALDVQFGIIVLAYLAQNLLYSFWLKHIPIIDVLVLASGYVLRVAAGVALITVERFSPWLYICTTLLALFLGFGKRRAEMVTLAEGANVHRRVLDGYTLPLLDQLLVIVSASTIMAYSLYTFSAENLPENHLMMLTIPFVIYGIFRYLLLIQVENAGGAPDELVFSDRPLLLTFILWALAAMAILYFG